MKMGCHKKAAACAPVAYEYAAPACYAAPQATPAAQASGQGM